MLYKVYINTRRQYKREISLARRRAFECANCYGGRDLRFKEPKVLVFEPSSRLYYQIDDKELDATESEKGRFRSAEIIKSIAWIKMGRKRPKFAGRKIKLVKEFDNIKQVYNYLKKVGADPSLHFLYRACTDQREYKGYDIEVIDKSLLRKDKLETIKRSILEDL